MSKPPRVLDCSKEEMARKLHESRFAVIMLTARCKELAESLDDFDLDEPWCFPDEQLPEKPF